MRVSVVAGGEDVGVPREIFEPAARTEYRASAPRQQVSLERFLGDSRLVHLFAQNYDLLGCNPFSGCATKGMPLRLVSRVSPLPLGLDLHTLAEKTKPGSVPVPACHQQTELDSLRASLPPWSRRDATTLLMSVGCTTAALKASGGGQTTACDTALDMGSNSKAAGQTRPYACDVLRPPLAKRVPGRLTKRGVFWRAVGSYAFVAAPIGHGADTHRLWEILALGSVPVVTAGSLDILYDHLPVIRIRSWCDLAGFSANASVARALLRGWKQELEARYGEEPFSADVRGMLTTDYWVSAIRKQHAAAIGGGFPGPRYMTQNT